MERVPHAGTGSLCALPRPQCDRELAIGMHAVREQREDDGRTAHAPRHRSSDLSLNGKLHAHKNLMTGIMINYHELPESLWTTNLFQKWPAKIRTPVYWNIVPRLINKLFNSWSLGKGHDAVIAKRETSTKGKHVGSLKRSSCGQA